MLSQERLAFEKDFSFFFFTQFEKTKRDAEHNATRRGIVGNHVGDRRSIVRPVAVSKPRGSRFKERDQPLAGGGGRRKREWLVRFFLLSRSCRFDDRRRTSAIDDSDDSRRKSVWIVATSRGTHVVSASSRFRSNGHDNGARDVHIRALPPHVLLFIRRSIYNIPSLFFFSFYPPLSFFFNFERGKVNTR